MTGLKGSEYLHDKDARDVLKYGGITLVMNKGGLSIKNGCTEGFLESKLVPGVLERDGTPNANFSVLQGDVKL